MAKAWTSDNNDIFLKDELRRVVEKWRPLSTLSVERIAALYEAAKHINRARFPGDIVVCGVYRGASAGIIAEGLIATGDTDRTIHLFDTFSGMPPGTDIDVQTQGTKREAGFWDGKLACDEITVLQNVANSGYPKHKFVCIAGLTQDTISWNLPKWGIALAHLDTDYYESTKAELQHVWPSLFGNGGLMMIDDYNEWEGQKKAVDEWLETLPERQFLHRVDNSAVMIEKRLEDI